MEPQGIQMISKAGLKIRFICSLGKGDHFLQDLPYVTISLIHYYINKCVSIGSRLHREDPLVIDFGDLYLHLIN